MREKIINIFAENIFTAPKIIRTTPELMKWVIENSSLDKPVEHSLVENAYSATTGETNICEFGKTKRFKTYNKGYLNCGGQCECAIKKMKATNLEKYGTECSVQSPEIKEQVKQTMMDKYGVENAFQATEVKEKIKETNLEKYGVEYPAQLQSTIEKMKATTFGRYGVEHALQSPTIKQKARQTTLDRYGVEHNWQSPDIREAAKETMLERYGVMHQMKSDEIKTRMQATMIDRYGAKNSLQTPIIKEKMIATMIDKYGVENFSQIHLPIESVQALIDKDRLKALLEANTLSDIAELLFVDRSTVKYYAIKHGLMLPLERSQAENEIVEFLDRHSLAYIRNDRKLIQPFELDFYLRDYNIAIEFNGLYWHSEKFKEKNYHSNKTNACMSLGIQLIHIFEDEWKNSKEVIKKKILHLCGKTNKAVIGGRKLNIKEVDKHQVSEFINNNHVQKMSPGASHYIAVNHNDKLVAAVLLKKISDGVVDMTRFCTDQQATYPGLMSKIVAFIKKNYNYDKLVTFADLRYSTGDVYVKSGFTEVSRIGPDYSYVRGINRYHKFNFRKNKISTMFGITSENKTEAMMAEEAGLLRIYDSGKIKYEFNLSKAGES